MRWLLMRRTAATMAVLAAMLLATVISESLIGAARNSGMEETHVGVVIYFDSDEIEYHLVEVLDDSMSGIELLMQTSRELEIQPFGGLGEAVCRIEETGCPSSDCFCESYSSPAFFWNFYLFEDGQWVPQLRGAAQHSVMPGEIHGWVWTAGDHDLPEVDFEDFESLSGNLPEATPSPGPTATPEPAEPDDEASARDDDASSVRCLQFVGALGLLSGIAVLAGIGRYGGQGRR